MEDLAISPWENSEAPTETHLLELSHTSPSKIHKPLLLKDRQIFTESKEQSPHDLRNSKSLLNHSLKKKQSSSAYQKFFQAPTCKRPSKLELKLVAFPIQENCQKRQTGIRFSQKMDTKSKFLNQSFEVIETIFNSQLKLLRVFKQRPYTKHYTLKENLLNDKIQTKNFPRFSQSLDRLKIYMRDNYDNTDTTIKQVKRFKEHQMKFLAENKQKIEKLQQMTKKPTVNSLKFNKYQNLKLQHLDLPELNHTLDDRKMNQTNQYESRKEQREKSKKLQEREKKLCIQKLENINCFRDTTNIFTKLQRKNKVLFNQLEKYNLFGLKNLKNKVLAK